MKLLIDNWRWADVPFYLRTGKRLRGPQHAHRHPVPAGALCFIPRHAGGKPHAQPTGACTSSRRKEFRCSSPPRFPGPTMRLGAVDMNFEYADYFGTTTQHRLRATAARLHDRRRHAVSARGHGGGGMVRGQPGVWTCGRRCRRAIFPTTRPEPGAPKKRTNFWSAMATPLEEFREMILAGDIGGTQRPPGASSMSNHGDFRLVSSFGVSQPRSIRAWTRSCSSLWTANASSGRGLLRSRWPGSNGRVETSNLPWIIESQAPGG